MDLVISAAKIVDGTGAPARVGDVGVDDGRVVAIAGAGELAGEGQRVIEADGRVVAPGFIDVHTHYDAQLLWDPAATPSSLHGVTTVLGGNCGFTLAPLEPDDADYLRRMMSRVEGMPLEALETGLDWSWRSFGDYLARLEGAIAVNAGFLVGHSALRRLVLGPEAAHRDASGDELERMRVLLAESIEAGGLGFSSSQSTAHTDGDGEPVPSRLASRDEILLLAAQAGRHPGTTLEFITTGCMGRLTDDELRLLADMSIRGGRPVNWNVLTPDPADPEGVEHQLSAARLAAEGGGRVVALAMPSVGPTRIQFLDYAALFSIPAWAEWFRRPLAERKQQLADPEVRARLDAAAHAPEVGRLSALANWAAFEVGDTVAPQNAPYTGRRVGDIAAAEGRDPFEVVASIALADDLRTGFWLVSSPPPEFTRYKAEVLADPRVLVGGSDAGAHLDRMCSSRYPTRFLAEFARETEVMSVEEVVHHMTGAPAAYFGLVDRGVLRVGAHGDLVVFDPATVDAERIEKVADLPGGAERLTSAARGVDHVFANGVEIVADGTPTGATPGTVLRSGRDTR